MSIGDVERVQVFIPIGGDCVRLNADGVLIDVEPEQAVRLAEILIDVSSLVRKQRMAAKISRQAKIDTIPRREKNRGMASE